MKKLVLFIILLLPLLSKAGHVGGIDLFYTHITGNTYRITMVVFGNCRDGNNNYPSLLTNNPQIDIIDSVQRSKFKTLELNLLTDSVTNASPYCERYKDSTNCQYPSSIYQGYTRFIYTDTVTLPRKSAKWIFRFNSSMNPGCGGRLGRPALNNYTNPTGNNAIIDAMLNNTTIDNSSPVSRVAVFPAYCINVPSVYDQLTSDPDQDSLVYEIITPMHSSNCVTIQYLAPVANYTPLHVVPGSYNFDRRNGRLTFTGDLTQTSAVNVKISEYRNGVLIGFAMRERIFKILGTCNNQPPVAPIDTNIQFSGATLIGKDSLITCPGNTVSFHIPVTNPFGDTVRASVEQVISGSNVVIINNNTTSPQINFSWNTVGVANGVYTFSTRFVTRSCPLPSTSLGKYTIIVNGAGEAAVSTLSPTNCVSKAAVKYELTNGRAPYDVTITKGGTVVGTYTSTTGIIEDSLEAGSYRVKVISQGIPCVTEMDFNVSDSGIYPIKPTTISPINYCRNAEAKPLLATGDSVATLTWYDPNRLVYTNGIPVPSTTTGGTSYWYVTNKYKTCESEEDSIEVVIDPVECDYDVTVYNVITPNGDGKNDRWMVKNTQYYPNMLVQVFSKLGDKVYERRGYNNEWDGDNLPSGTYYYVVRLNGVNKTSGKDTYTGYLLIKR